MPATPEQKRAMEDKNLQPLIQAVGLILKKELGHVLRASESDASSWDILGAAVVEALDVMYWRKENMLCVFNDQVEVIKAKLPVIIEQKERENAERLAELGDGASPSSAGDIADGS